MIETKFEIGEKSKTKMSYADAVFYCFCLGDGWRLPTEEEYDLALDEGWYDDECWFQDDDSPYNWHVIPVRDLKDD